MGSTQDRIYLQENLSITKEKKVLQTKMKVLRKENDVLSVSKNKELQRRKLFFAKNMQCWGAPGTSLGTTDLCK